MASIVITGSSQRLGLFLVQHYIAQGDKVFAVTRKSSEQLLNINSDQLTIIEIDQYSEQAAINAAEKIAQSETSIELLVNNASAFFKDTQQSDEGALFTQSFNTHMLFPLCLTSQLSPLLKQKGNAGVVINITDIYSTQPKTEHALYCSSKAGMSNLSMGLAKRYAGLIRVNSIAPGPIKFLDSHSEQQKQDIMAQAIIKQEGGFESILKTIEFIRSNDYLTGITINVDGGRSINSW
ncbi:MAG: SDR family NAD(P)-dependent oxidoreductase [Enterobacterales bacterium]|nr:SDR family NAD(P)-dependent oxidoreductase [Enterobacterales bacterium]